MQGLHNVEALYYRDAPLHGPGLWARAEAPNLPYPRKMVSQVDKDGKQPLNIQATPKTRPKIQQAMSLASTICPNTMSPPATKVRTQQHRCSIVDISGHPVQSHEFFLETPLESYWSACVPDGMACVCCGGEAVRVGRSAFCLGAFFMVEYFCSFFS